MDDRIGSRLTADNYPPQRHMLRDLLVSMEFGGKRQGTVRAPVVPEICTDRGGVQVGVMATLVDVLGGGLAIRAIYPDWMATADLSLYMTGRATSGSITASGKVIREGRSMVVIEADILEETESSARSPVWIGSAVMTFARLPCRKDTVRIADESTTSVAFGIEGSGLSRPYIEELGIRIPDGAAGVAEVEMSGYVRNSFKVLQGGAVATLADIAGQHAARAATGKPLVTRDLTIHYLSQGKVGPFRTRSRVVRTTSDTALTRVEVIDTGAGDQIMTVVMNSAALDETAPKR